MRVEQKQFLNLQEFIIDIIGEFSIKDKISVIFRPATYPIFSTFGKFDSIYKATREILIYPHTVLKEPAQLIDNVDDKLVALVTDMNQPLGELIHHRTRQRAPNCSRHHHQHFEHLQVEEPSRLHNARYADLATRESALSQWKRTIIGITETSA